MQVKYFKHPLCGANYKQKKINYNKNTSYYLSFITIWYNMATLKSLSLLKWHIHHVHYNKIFSRTYKIRLNSSTWKLETARIHSKFIFIYLSKPGNASIWSFSLFFKNYTVCPRNIHTLHKFLPFTYLLPHCLPIINKKTGMIFFKRLWM